MLILVMLFKCHIIIRVDFFFRKYDVLVDDVQTQARSDKM